MPQRLGAGRQVRPISRAHEEHRRGEHWISFALMAAVAGLIAVVFLVAGGESDPFEPEEPSPGSLTGAPADEALQPSPPPEPEPDPPDPTLRDLVPGVEDQLVVLYGNAAPEVATWSPTDTTTRTRPLPFLTQGDIAFDAAERQIAFLAPSIDDRGSTLYLGTLINWTPARFRVQSLAWHLSEPGELGWLESAESGATVLCRGFVDVRRKVFVPECVAAVAWDRPRLVSYDDAGFLVADPEGGRIHRLDGEGAVTSSVRAEDAYVSAEGDVLLVGDGPGPSEVVYFLTGPDLAELRALWWAPQPPSPAQRLAVWSPTRRHIAFLAKNEVGGPQLQVWSTEGSLLHRSDLPGPTRDMSWGGSGRFIVLTGASETGNAIFFYDTLGFQLRIIAFEGWIKDVHLVADDPPTILPALGPTAAAGGSR